MTDTFTSDSGVKYDVVEVGNEYIILQKSSAQIVEMNGEKYITEDKNLQKSSQYREVKGESTSPTESDKKDFWKRFADIIQEWTKYWDIENLLWWTLWTIGKRYDEEEQYDTIRDDTQEWIEWIATYMND